jgi:hypothetical protein
MFKPDRTFNGIVFRDFEIPFTKTCRMTCKSAFHLKPWTFDMTNVKVISAQLQDLVQSFYDGELSLKVKDKAFGKKFNEDFNGYVAIHGLYTDAKGVTKMRAELLSFD